MAPSHRVLLEDTVILGTKETGRFLLPTPTLPVSCRYVKTRSAHTPGCLQGLWIEGVWIVGRGCRAEQDADKDKCQ